MPAAPRSTVTFSLLGLLGLVSLAGVAFAALKAATPLWASATFSAALLVLAFALLGSLQGSRRRYWAGFAIFGWGYLALVYGPGLETSVRPRLLTTQFLSWANERWHGTPPNAPMAFTTFSNGTIVTGTPMPYVAGSSRLPASALWTITGVPPTSPVTLEHFEQIGHSLFALLAGLLGGLATVWLWRDVAASPAPQPIKE